ncbi:signal transduction histidine kinase [Hamadaea flava]|uniref:histidine kinase n=1 Tax=Hamadaea flava TaxID=1742688 RepID=A0ABV8LR15_9ACTN|nr:nitrate- and nitrite sensing domain-containing protein [Hamadaea flava]MCP2327277.1 signal transduction histidine kinase [Hamadaea flava]
MSSRTSRLRAKIAFLLASLAALWAFAAFVTVRDGLTLLWIRTLDSEVGRPTNALVQSVQEERRRSAVYLALAEKGDTAASATARTALDTARQHTDEAVSVFRNSVRGTAARWAQSDTTAARLSELDARLNALPAERSDMDAGRVERSSVTAFYTGVVGKGYEIFETISVFSDRDINSRLGHLLTLSRGRELLSQEDALISGVIAAGRFSPAEAAEFGRIVGAQRYTRSVGVAGLPGDTAIYQPVLEGQELGRFQALEDQIVLQGPGAAPVTAAAWRAALDPALASLAQLDIDLADATIDQATGPGVMIVVRLILAAGLGLIAVVASIILSITTARAIVHQLRLLRDAADDLATVRLPRVVERLAAGEEVDVEAEAPPLAFGSDEIGQVGHAFTKAQETAVRVAVDQAELRRGVRDVFVSLARRNQALIHSQLRLLDDMECRVTDPTDLEELFRVDHLATRMRRNAENLLVLSGATAGRGWRRPVPVADILRAACAEVEGYHRVVIQPGDAAELAGRAVGDVIHLLAELVENALSFSPPDTTVHVKGARVGTGHVLEVEDRGLGMSEAVLDESNELLRDPPEFKLTSTARLGLFVVGRLAQRHEIEVQLRRSPYGGVTAIVLIPEKLISGRPPASELTLLEAAVALPSVPEMRPRAAAAPVALAVRAEPPVRVVTARTPSGLPVRPKPNPSAPAQARDIRDLMSAFQRGTQRGRAEAVETPAEGENNDAATDR